jgi:acetolactate synthase-1/2/3 large subunit/5-guanidino-2-oxopentanoate decarboxylase
MMKTTLGAQISHALKARDVDVIFGIPGVHNVELYRGIEEAGITHVLARHEQGAAFMADGYARATGKPGVCYLITGPGFLNAATPLAQAYSDSVPVLSIASCLDETASQRGQLHQMLDQVGAGRAICDWSEQVSEPDAAYALIDRAFAEFACQRPRSKALHIPINALGTAAKTAPPQPPVPDRPVASYDQINTIVTALLQAERPLFIFGGGCVGADDAAREVLRLSGAASFVTYAGRGVVAPDDPLFFGSNLSQADSATIAEMSDLVLVFGSELAEVDLWRNDLGHTCKMIRVDIDPGVLAQARHGDLTVLGDTKSVLEALAVAMPARAEARALRWDHTLVREKRVKWRAEVASDRPGIREICDLLRPVMPKDTMVYSDMTQFAYVAKDVWDMPRSGHWHHPYGFGTLGYALPAAIGGAVARPNAPTLAIAGDYGLQYTLPELATAVELQLPLPILVWDNQELAEIKDSMQRSQISPNAVVAQNPDFLALAQSYGAFAEAPQSAKHLQEAVTKAFDADRPTVIRVTSDAKL